METLIRRECLRDPIHFISTHCKVQSDTGAGLIPFSLFGYQEDLLRTFLIHREVIVLKARQLGITELVAAYAVWAALKPYQTIVAISQGDREAGELIRKARTAWEHLPGFLRPALKNPRLLSTLEFTNGSRILPQPATERSGRSFNAQILILDEWAWQQFADEVYDAASPTALSAGNQIIGISTANGVGNLFHQQWLLAQEGRGMHPVFLPWHVRPGRTPEWFAHTTRTLSEDKIAQNYPTTADGAFLLSGRPRFDQAALSAISVLCQEPTTTILGDGAELVWEPPTKGTRYVCGADTAEGLAKGDYDAAVILDWETGQEVAALHGHWPMDVYAAHLARLCSRYNMALLGVERNNHGHSVLLALQTIERYPSASLYRHTEYDAKNQGASEGHVGWQTSTKSKPIMIDALATAVREMGASPPAREPAYRNRSFVGEARTYAVLDNGGTGASGSLNDDWVVAYAIAEQMRAVPQEPAPVLAMRISKGGWGYRR